MFMSMDSEGSFLQSPTRLSILSPDGMDMQVYMCQLWQCWTTLTDNVRTLFLYANWYTLAAGVLHFDGRIGSLVHHVMLLSILLWGVFSESPPPPLLSFSLLHPLSNQITCFLMHATRYGYSKKLTPRAKRKVT